MLLDEKWIKLQEILVETLQCTVYVFNLDKGVPYFLKFRHENMAPLVRPDGFSISAILCSRRDFRSALRNLSFFVDNILSFIIISGKKNV